MNIPISCVSVNRKPVTKVHLEAAKTTGVQAARVEEIYLNAPSFKEVSKWCFELGLKLVWICNLTDTAGNYHKNETSGKTFVEQWAELGANEKSVVILIEFGNELWPGGSSYGPPWENMIAKTGPTGQQEYTGKEYAERFIQFSKELKEAAINVPCGLQVQTSEAAVARTWMTQIGEASHAELTTALEPRAGLPGGNWIVSHPYMGKATLSQKEPNNLITNNKCGEDTGGQLWGSQRWMKQQQLVKEWTGLLVPMAITEYGVCKGPGSNEVPGGTWAAVAEYCELFWQHIRTAGLGLIAAPPTGLTPNLVLATWYGLYTGVTGSETFGVIKESDGLPNEESNLFKKFKEGVLALQTIAPGLPKTSQVISRMAAMRSSYR